MSKELLEDILPFLDEKKSSSKDRAHAIVELAGLFQRDSDGSCINEINAYLLNLLDDSAHGLSYRLAFSSLTSIFHINLNVASDIFQKLSKKQFKLSSNLFKDNEILESLLELLSAACGDKTNRDIIKAKYADLLNQSITSGKSNEIVKVLAATILIKLLATTNQPTKEVQVQENEEVISTLADMLRVVVLQNQQSTLGAALEGLTYASLNFEVKNKLIQDEQCLKIMLDTSKSQKTSPLIHFGILTILVNLTSYPAALSKEDEDIRKLRAHANSTTANKDESRNIIDDRNKVLLRLGVLSSLVVMSRQPTPNSGLAIGNLLKALATVSNNRSKIVQQGGISILLSLLTSSLTPARISLNTPESSIPQTFNIPAACALAKILISVNPDLAFLSKYTPSAAVSPLVRLLDTSSDDVTLLDQFESLLALTNLASSEKVDVSSLIVNNAWDSIENLLISNNIMIQRATTELVCNLVSTPAGASKYLDAEDKDSHQNIRVLVALSDAEDLKTRSAASGAIALLSEWGDESKKLAYNEPLIQALIRLIQDDDDGIRLRAAVGLRNLVIGVSDDEKSQIVLKLIRKFSGLSALKTHIKKVHDVDLQRDLSIVLQKLVD
ncbi:armadillo-type protein [Lipomyces japonicus]|uniref:armadillo-type protein n=1 Tax=Lipomyces japonicus TaxID=56871 RepID=UPI0034CF8C0C